MVWLPYMANKRKKSDNMFSRFDTIPACDRGRQTDR